MVIKISIRSSNEVLTSQLVKPIVVSPIVEIGKGCGGREDGKVGGTWEDKMIEKHTYQEVEITSWV